MHRRYVRDMLNCVEVKGGCHVLPEVRCSRQQHIVSHNHRAFLEQTTVLQDQQIFQEEVADMVDQCVIYSLDSTLTEFLHSSNSLLSAAACCAETVLLKNQPADASQLFVKDLVQNLMQNSAKNWSYASQ